ncbi:MAG: hypothetical protein JW774_07060 [Candidatus Aureabacteria bacterium]|nr:hypothetical protein [Candidatus Auribacterota bacterium]
MIKLLKKITGNQPDEPPPGKVFFGMELIRGTIIQAYHKGKRIKQRPDQIWIYDECVPHERIEKDMEVEFKCGDTLSFRVQREDNSYTIQAFMLNKKLTLEPLLKI